MKLEKIKRGLRGFTLTEVLIALSLVAVLVSISVMAFKHAGTSINESLVVQDVDRLANILKTEMKTVRNDERTTSSPSENKYRNSFDKGFYWLQKSKTPRTSIVIFSYRGDLSAGTNPDGTLKPIPASESIPGKNSTLVTIACPANDPVHCPSQSKDKKKKKDEDKSSFESAVGTIYIVKMTEISATGGGQKGKNAKVSDKSSGVWKTADKPGTLSFGSTPDEYITNYPEQSVGGGSVLYRADFYVLHTRNPDRIPKNWNDEEFDEPAFSVVMSFGIAS